MKAIATTLKDDTYNKLERYKKIYNLITTDKALSHMVEDYFNIIETYFDADLTADGAADIAEKTEDEDIFEERCRQFPIEETSEPYAEEADPFEKALKHEDLIYFEELADGEKFKFYTPIELREPDVYYDSVYIKTWDGTGVDIEDGYVTKPIEDKRLIVRVKEVTL